MQKHDEKNLYLACKMILMWLLSDDFGWYAKLFP